jgi:hypothetical protein
MAEVWLDVMDEWSRRVFNLIDAVSAAGSSATPRRIQCKTDEDEGIDDGPRCCVCAEARADCLLGTCRGREAKNAVSRGVQGGRVTRRLCMNPLACVQCTSPPQTEQRTKT